jgi:hypothetical protein
MGKLLKMILKKTAKYFVIMLIFVMITTKLTENMILTGIILNGVITGIGFIFCTKDVLDSI